MQYEALKKYIDDISENGFKDVNLNSEYPRKVPTKEGGTPSDRYKITPLEVI